LDPSALPVTGGESDVLVLADRAELWASIAPGLGHHLANALTTLSVPTRDGEVRQGARQRIEQAHRVLNGMCGEPGTDSRPLAAILDDVDAWHGLQLGLPRASLRIEVAANLAATADTRLHHAIIALVTLAKQDGATALWLSARRDEEGVVIDFEATLSELGRTPASDGAIRRRVVIGYLLRSLGATYESAENDTQRRWSIQLPAAPRPASTGRNQTMLSSS
jgi:hypothetical protein